VFVTDTSGAAWSWLSFERTLLRRTIKLYTELEDLERLRLALQYAQHYKIYIYDVCRFIDASKREESVLAFARAMGVVADSTSPVDLPAVMKALYDQLEEHSWLLISDNVPEVDYIEKLFPVGRNRVLAQHVLLTTRCRPHRDGMLIEGFLPGDGLGFLKALFPTDEEETLQALSAIVGHSPCALNLVCMATRKSGFSLSTYMDYCVPNPLGALNETGGDGSYCHAYPAVLGLNCIESEEARRLLKVCLQYKGVEVPIIHIFEAMKTDMDKLVILMKNLNCTSLIEETEGHAVLHPLLRLLNEVDVRLIVGPSGEPIFSPRSPTGSLSCGSGASTPSTCEASPAPPNCGAGRADFLYSSLLLVLLFCLAKYFSGVHT
jgi:hypothetical protein